MAKEKDFSLPMFTEAYEKYGVTLRRENRCRRGRGSHRDGETRMTVSTVRAIDRAIAELAEEVTWLIDPAHEDPNNSPRIVCLGGSWRRRDFDPTGLCPGGRGGWLVVETDQGFPCA